MASTGKWVAGASPAGTPLAVLGAGLNSLANNAASAVSSAIANQTNLDLYGIFTVHLASLTPVAGGYITLYILAATDNATYPAATAAALRNQPDKILWTFPLDTAAAAQDLVTPLILLPPCGFKIVLDNQSGVALAAAANTVTLITSNFNLNG